MCIRDRESGALLAGGSTCKYCPDVLWLRDKYLSLIHILCNGLCAVVQKSQQNATGGAEAAGLMLVGFCTAARCV